MDPSVLPLGRWVFFNFGCEDTAYARKQKIFVAKFPKVLFLAVFVGDLSSFGVKFFYMKRNSWEKCYLCILTKPL